MLGDANFTGCHSTRKSTMGGIAMWSGQFVKAWSNTMGLALSSGESELAAVVRVQQKAWDCKLFSTTSVCVAMWQLNLTQPQQSGWDKSDIWLLKTSGCNTMLVQGKFEFPKMPGLENPSDAQTKYLGREPFLRHTEACGTCQRVVIDHKSRTRKPTLLITSCE